MVSARRLSSSLGRSHSVVSVILQRNPRCLTPLRSFHHCGKPRVLTPLVPPSNPDLRRPLRPVDLSHPPARAHARSDARIDEATEGPRGALHPESNVQAGRCTPPHTLLSVDEHRSLTTVRWKTTSSQVCACVRSCRSSRRLPRAPPTSSLPWIDGTSSKMISGWMWCLLGPHLALSRFRWRDPTLRLP